MFIPPKSRFRFYGSPGNYFTVVKDLLLGQIQKHNDIEVLEKRIADMTGMEYAVCTPQARVAIYLTFQTLLKGRPKVILSPYTIYDVINMVICAGGRPIFADIERETCNIDPKEVERLIDDETGAVLITHLHGLACDLPRITNICKENNVPLIEDSAQAFGAKVNEQAVGTFGEAGIYSFGRAKNLNSFYGGMVVTNNRSLYDRINSELQSFAYFESLELLKRTASCLMGDILTHPLAFGFFTFWVFRYGYLHNIDMLNNQIQTESNPELKRIIPENYLRRMTPMQARMVNAQLDGVDQDSKTRIGYARLYHEGLSRVPQILLPPLRLDGSHIYLAYPIQVPDRHGLLRFLMQHGRDLAIQHITNTSDLSCFQEYQLDCPNARQTANQVLLLPSYPGYGIREVEKNIFLIRKFFGVA